MAETETWSLAEAIDKYLTVQNKIIDQRQVHQSGVYSHHLHFLGWGSLDQQRVKAIKKYEPLIKRIKPENDSYCEAAEEELRLAFTEHFANLGIVGNVEISSIKELPITPKGLILPTAPYPIEPAFALCYWHDLRPLFRITDKKVIDTWPLRYRLPQMGPFVNTTQLGDNSEYFSVDTAIRESRSRDRAGFYNFFEDEINSLRHWCKNRFLNIDSFSITQEGQEIMTALLGAMI